MNQKLIVTIEIEKNGRNYVFNMNYGAPIGEAYDAAHQCLQEIIKMGQQAADASKNVGGSDEQ